MRVYVADVIEYLPLKVRLPHLLQADDIKLAFFDLWEHMQRYFYGNGCYFAPCMPTKIVTGAPRTGFSRI